MFELRTPRGVGSIFVQFTHYITNDIIIHIYRGLDVRTSETNTFASYSL